MKIESPLILIGVFLIIAGILIIIFSKVPFLGKLPGDIQIKRDNFVFFFPIVSCIVISIIITLILNFTMRK